MCAPGSFPGAIRPLDASAAPRPAWSAGEHRASNRRQDRPVRDPLDRAHDQAGKVEAVRRRLQVRRGQGRGPDPRPRRGDHHPVALTGPRLKRWRGRGGFAMMDPGPEPARGRRNAGRTAGLAQADIGNAQLQRHDPDRPGPDPVVKVLAGDDVMDQRLSARWQGEGRVWSRLRHATRTRLGRGGRPPGWSRSRGRARFAHGV